MKKLIGKFTQADEIKRFYFNGEITVKCPKCKSMMVHDFSDQYLMHPEIGKKDVIGLNCEDCDEVYYLNLTVKSIDVVIEYDDKKLSTNYESLK